MTSSTKRTSEYTNNKPQTRADLNRKIKVEKSRYETLLYVATISQVERVAPPI